MLKFRPSSIALSMVLSLFVLAVTSCGSYNYPEIDRGPGYETVELGAFKYIVPKEFSVVTSGKNFVVHQCSTVPGSKIEIKAEASPPRSLKIDADSAKRKFLKELPSGNLSSSQYYEKDGREVITIFYKGREKDGTRLYAILSVVRETGKTVYIEHVAPWEYKDAMLDANKLLLNLIELK